MTTNQLKLNKQLNSGLKITQKNNRLWIDGEILNTKTLVSYIIKKFPNIDYRLKLNQLITII
jgi:hypothetical protein